MTQAEADAIMKASTPKIHNVATLIELAQLLAGAVKEAKA